MPMRVRALLPSRIDCLAARTILLVIARRYLAARVLVILSDATSRIKSTAKTAGDHRVNSSQQGEYKTNVPRYPVRRMPRKHGDYAEDRAMTRQQLAEYRAKLAGKSEEELLLA